VNLVRQKVIENPLAVSFLSDAKKQNQEVIKTSKRR
jgi:hypothetical protein